LAFLLAAVRPLAAVTIEARSAYGPPNGVGEVGVHIRTMGMRVDSVVYDLNAVGLDIQAANCNRGTPLEGGGVHIERTRIGGFPDDTALQTCTVQLPSTPGTFPLSLTNVFAAGPGGTPIPATVVTGEIAAVLQTPTPTPTFTPGTETPICGNFNIEQDEQCDDGNTVGADGCALNCTDEREWPFTFRSATCAGGDNDGQVCDIDADCPPDGICTGVRTMVSAQGRGLQIPLGLHGTQLVRAGSARPADVVDRNGQVVARSGDIPVAFNLADSQIDAIPIPPFACACVRFFGLGTVAARGVISCSEQGRDDVDQELDTDHDVSDVNPQCIDGRIEQSSERHPGACNFIPTGPKFGGNGPRGSAILETGLAIALFGDGGRCCQAGVDPDCDDPFMDKGADGIPCNGDDFLIGDVTRVFLTTGTAKTSIVDADAVPGARIAAGSRASCILTEDCPAADEVCVDTDTGAECDIGSSACQCRVLCGNRLCVVENSGHAFDCDAIEADGPDRFAGGVLVSASVLFDSPLGDNAITSTLIDASTGEPTATATRASTGTPTPPPTDVPPTATLTPTPAAPACTGDCNRDGSVTVDEIVTAVNIALGSLPVAQCQAADGDGGGTVTVDEIVTAVNKALNGC
jgi:cysteine-rich repeat protein